MTELLTASQARELAEKSDEEITRHAKLVVKKVEELALRGKYSMRITEAVYSDNKYELRDWSGWNKKLTSFQEDLKKKLEGLGYKWSIETQTNDPKKTFGYMGETNVDDHHLSRSTPTTLR